MIIVICYLYLYMYGFIDGCKKFWVYIIKFIGVYLSRVGNNNLCEV